MTRLVNWLVTALSGAVDPANPAGPVDRNEYVRRCAEGADPPNVPAAAAAVIKRYAPIAVVMNDFYWKLHLQDRTTPYPVDELQRVCSATGFKPVLSSAPQPDLETVRPGG